jgi:hypothetical protein
MLIASSEKREGFNGEGAEVGTRSSQRPREARPTTRSGCATKTGRGVATEERQSGDWRSQVTRRLAIKRCLGALGSPALKAEDYARVGSRAELVGVEVSRAHGVGA